MKKLFILATLGLTLLTVNAMAEYYPDLSFAFQGLLASYDGAGGLGFIGQSQSVNFGAGAQNITAGSVSMTAQLTSVSNGVWSFNDTANNSNINISGTVDGYTSPLVKGYFSNLSFQSATDSITGLIDITGGSLYPLNSVDNISLSLGQCSGDWSCGPLTVWSAYGNGNVSPSVDPVPEPISLLLLGLGMVGFIGFRKRVNA